jgi:hypothetical protein
MIERVPQCGYQRFYRSGVYQIINDYFKLADAATAIGQREYKRSARLLFGNECYTEYFERMCDGCGLEAPFVIRRINEFIANPLKDNYDWINVQNLAQCILGLCDFPETTTSFKKRGRKTKKLKLKLVKG